MKNIYNYPLKTLNTFRVNGIVKRFVEIDTLDNVDYLFDEKLFKGKFLIIGEGSNMLFTDDFEGTIIRIATKGIKKIKETEEHVWLKVEAGETWEDFVNYCISNQYFGVENLIGIPGWVGSASVQNIGAYGVEVKDVIEKVEGVFIANKKKFIFSSHDCKFGYRDSVFKNKFKNSVIITSVIFKLSKKEYYTLTYKALHDYLQNDSSTISLSAVAKAVLDIRNSKLPDIQKIGSAGSFFKNPIISPKKAEELSLNYPNLSYIPTE
ncbi:MAG TPA: UDP-N-acetylmuramate dehydrogenase, partial [Bacteroidales bacterium]|nr:UDP-N-acetylmuramate dehydrogenase [Bacteroidales bacterium]